MSQQSGWLEHNPTPAPQPPAIGSSRPFWGARISVADIPPGRPLASAPISWHTLARRAGGRVDAREVMSRVVGGWKAIVAAFLCLALAAAGCAPAPERIAVPAALASEASLPGLADVRLWGDAPFSPALMPVTRSNSGRSPRVVQPTSSPAPNAPSSAPPESASRLEVCGSPLLARA